MRFAAQFRYRLVSIRLAIRCPWPTEIGQERSLVIASYYYRLWQMDALDPR